MGTTLDYVKIFSRKHENNFGCLVEKRIEAPDNSTGVPGIVVELWSLTSSKLPRFEVLLESMVNLKFHWNP